MKYSYPVFILFLLGCSKLAHTQPTTLRLDAIRETYPIGTLVEYLPDTAGCLTFAEVQHSNHFVRSQSAIPSFGFAKSVYWFKLRVHNADITHQWLLELGYSHFRTADLFLADSAGNVRETILAGNSRGTQHRPLPTHNYVFPLHIPPGQTRVVHLRADGMASKLFPLTIYEQHSFYETAQQTSLWLGYYFGFISITLLYHFFLFLYNRQYGRNYLFFSAYLVAYLLNELIRGNGNYVERLLLVHYPYWQEHVVALLNGVIVLVSLSGLRFYSIGLQLSPTSRWHRFLIGLSWANVLAYCLLLTGWLPSTWSLFFNFTVALLAYISVLLASLSRLAEGFRPAGYYFAATLILLTGVFIVLSERAGWLSGTSFWQHNAIQIASVIEIVLLTLGFAEGIRAERRRRNLDLELAGLTGRKTEREWLSVLLHTSFGTTLSAMRFKLYELDWKTLSPANANYLNQLNTQLHDAIQEVRFLSHSLPPTILDEQGLQAAFDVIVQNFNTQNRVYFTLTATGTPWRSDIRHEFELYLVGLELMHNTIHHSGATEAHLFLDWQPTGCLLLQIQDNGRGFGNVKPGGYGLTSIRRIVEQKLGGSIETSNRPTGGAHVGIRVTLPALIDEPLPGEREPIYTPIRRLF